MPTNARVVVLPPGTDRLHVRDLVLPDPGPHQVVLRLHSSGVCHSQLHQMQRERQAPLLLGHEGTGTVVATGRDVTHVAPGDTAIVTWVPRAPERGGRPPAATTLELPDGSTAVCQAVFTWADHTLADEQYVVRVPDTTPLDVSSIVGCAVMTGAGAVLNTAGVAAGDSVAVWGVGGVGLSAIAAAAVVGASPIIAVDLVEEKLEFARKFGATETVDASKIDPVEAVRALTGRPGRHDVYGQAVAGPDFTFDCIGLRVTMDQILRAARSGETGVERGGTAVLVGVPMTPAELDAKDLLVNEKRFVGSIGGSCVPDRDFPTFLDWHATGRLDLTALVTERFPLDAINEATDALHAGRIAGRAILELSDEARS